MVVSFDPARMGALPARETSPQAAPVSQTRGLLDFGSLMEVRGLLDARRSAAMETGPESAATRFDEGSLFGRATDVRGDFDGKAERSESAAEAVTEFPDETGAARSERETPQSRATDAGVRSASPSAVNDMAVASQLASRASADRSRDMAAMSASPAGGSAASRAQGSGTEVAGRAGLEARACYVEELGPVHVMARNSGDGLQITARVAGGASEQVELIERRLRKAATDDGARVSTVRLNGADRPDGMRRPGHG